MDGTQKNKECALRILFVTGAFPPMACGVGDYTARLVARLAAFPELDIGVLTSFSASKCLDPPEHFFPVVKKWNCSELTNVMHVINSYQPDIVHLQYPSSFGRTLLPNFLPIICSAKKIHTVQTWHELPIYSQVINAVPSDTLVVVDPRYPAAYPLPYRAVIRHKQCAYIPIGSNIPNAMLSQTERIEVRRRYNAEHSRLIVYFGFAAPHKGIEDLFQIADPDRDRLVLICRLDSDNPSHVSLSRHIESPPWKERCLVTGYLAEVDVARLLAVADAAIFPFRDGATPRNGSVLAARLQGSFVVTTHRTLRGYSPDEHTVYTAPGDVLAMREAVDTYAGTRFVGIPAVAPWEEIAKEHCNLYRRILY